LYDRLRPVEPELTEIHAIYPPGQEVTLKGNNLSPQGQLSLGGQALVPIEWGSQEIRFTVPPEAKQNEPLKILVVMRDTRELSGGEITVRLQPELIKITDTVKPKAQVVLYGKALGTTQGEVYLGTKRVPPTGWQPGQINFRVPQDVDPGATLSIKIR